MSFRPFRLAARLPRLLSRAALGLLALISLYLLAALTLGLLPVNRDWRQSDAGIPVFLDSNGVHAGLLLPRSGPGMNWDETFPQGIRAPGPIWTNGPMWA
ncbi:hypothetical protein [Chromobacterium haemolyticum]|uniref:hypothetical protein n=1 Tax=Chromobacterium haemolyticum TaxID=394935 RepID=UPI002953F12E|nr:hypothetical protein [Chromobacterium haemolyticum]WON81852.1 DUF2459 domain-containing protein [Chromobacterium haemolyticum]